MAAPTNDLCVNATVIPATLPYSLSGFDTTAATQDVDDPNNADAARVPFNTVWFTWTPTVNQVAAFDTWTSDYDTVLGVYTGACGGPWTTIAENDENFHEAGGLASGGGHTSRVQFFAIAGVTYTIVIGSFDAGGGSLALHGATIAPTVPSPITTIPGLPYDDSRDVNALGVTQTVWYGGIAPADGEIGIFAFGDLTTYLAALTVYQGDTDAVTTNSILLNLDNVQNRPVQFPVIGGVPYFFKVASAAGNVTSALLTFHAEQGRDDALADGQFVINDDAPGFPLVILDGTTALPVKFIQPFPDGEAADILPSGVSAFADNATARVRVYTADFLTARGTLGVSPGRLLSIRTNQIDAFYVGDPGLSSPVVVTVIDHDATVRATYTLPGTGLTGAAPSRDETVLYYTGASAVAQAVQRWNLVGNVAASDLAAGIASYRIPRPLLVLGDDSILVPYVQDGVDAQVLRYAPDGTLRNTYAFPLTGSLDFQIARELDDPLSFWAWEKRGAGLSVFTHVQVSTGVVLEELPATQFESGIYQGVVSDAPSARFGHSESCPFFLLRVPTAPIIDTACHERPTVTGTGAPGPPAPLVVTPPAVATITTDSADPVAVGFSATVSGGTGPFVVTFDPPSGSLFPLGDTLVTVTVTDVGG